MQTKNDNTQQTSGKSATFDEIVEFIRQSSKQECDEFIAQVDAALYNFAVSEKKGEN